MHCAPTMPRDAVGFFIGTGLVAWGWPSGMLCSAAPISISWRSLRGALSTGIFPGGVPLGGAAAQPMLVETTG
jgi:hypothetical protein